jgi:predicted RNase H-like nuclease (RuvC/YqgF family)
MEQALTTEDAASSDAARKVELTVSTLSGDYTHAFAEHDKLEHVIEKTIKALELQGEGPWILEFDGRELSHSETIKEAKLQDGDVLTLNPQGGGGGSECR